MCCCLFNSVKFTQLLLIVFASIYFTYAAGAMYMKDMDEKLKIVYPDSSAILGGLLYGIMLSWLILPGNGETVLERPTY